MPQLSITSKHSSDIAGNQLMFPNSGTTSANISQKHKAPCLTHPAARIGLLTTQVYGTGKLHFFHVLFVHFLLPLRE